MAGRIQIPRQHPDTQTSQIQSCGADSAFRSGVLGLEFGWDLRFWVLDPLLLGPRPAVSPSRPPTGRSSTRVAATSFSSAPAGALGRAARSAACAVKAGRCTRVSDIRSVQTRRRGEPIDPVMAAADGTVAYINTRARRLELRQVCRAAPHHRRSGSVHGVCAPERVRRGVEGRQDVKAGEVDRHDGAHQQHRERISLRTRACPFRDQSFRQRPIPDLVQKEHPKQPDDHGIWNGDEFARARRAADLSASSRRRARSSTS